MAASSRIELAVAGAISAFWVKIAEAFPEIGPADLHFADEIEFAESCESVVRLWIDTNAESMPRISVEEANAEVAAAVQYARERDDA